MRILLYYGILSCAVNLFAMQDSNKVSFFETLLFVAAQNNDVKKVAELIEKQKVNVNVRDSKGNSVLTVAALFNAKDVIKKLLCHNPDLNVPNNTGWYPLKWAVHTHNKELVQLLVNAGARVNEKDERYYTPLMDAYDDPEIAQLLIEAGADVNYQAHDKQTPLLRSVKEGRQLITIRLLIEKGAQDDFRDDEGCNAWDHVNHNRSNCIRARTCVSNHNRIECIYAINSAHIFEHAFSKHKLF